MIAPLPLAGEVSNEPTDLCRSCAIFVTDIVVFVAVVVVVLIASCIVC